jgi:hypothetical protein
MIRLVQNDRFRITSSTGGPVMFTETR